MRIPVLFLCASLAVAAELPVPEGWRAWAPRAEIAPRTFIDAGKLAISGNSNSAAYGGWEYTAPVEAGKWYRLAARYRTESITYERGQVVARLDWQTADGKRAGQPDYAWQTTRDGDSTQLVLDAPAPDKAVTVTVQLYLANAPQATIWWDAVSLDTVAPRPPRPVTVAAVNYRPEKTTGSSAETVRQFIGVIDKSVPAKTDIILLGEGITVVSTGLKYADVAEPVPGPTTERLGEVAKRRSTYIVAGIYEREGQAIYNTAVVIDRQGKLLGKYRKVYLPREELEGGLTPGNAYPVFQADFGKVGVMICWDLEYADPARALALRGAELILLPIWGGSEPLGKARAIENHVFLASAGYDYPTYVLDPNGETLATATGRGTTAVATIDLNKRYLEPWLGDMRSRFMKELRLDVPVAPR